MTIQRDIRDNKIQRNLGGEVLRTPPTTVLSSKYGVTKDGSNLVSIWKDKTNPFNFRPHIGGEPTENGDGMELTPTKGVGANLVLNYDNIILSAWTKLNDTITTQHYFSKWSISAGFGYEFLFRFTTDLLRLIYSTDGTAFVTKTVGIYTPGFDNIWRHVGIWFQKTAVNIYSIAFLIDGKIYAKENNISINLTQKIYPLRVGARYPNNDSGIIGSIDDFEIWNNKFDMNNYPNNGDFVFTPQKRSSE